jgi:hypothetical protein
MGNVGRSGNSVLATTEESCVEQLARFFPQARPVKIPVQVTSSRGSRTLLREATVVEFSGGDHAIFLSTLPLEFGDRVRLESRPEGNLAEATVDGLQYDEGCKAVAVKFLQAPCDWLLR